jgi:subtilase family serine protease
MRAHPGLAFAVLAGALAGCDAGVTPQLDAAALTPARGILELEGSRIPASDEFRVTVTDPDPNVDPELPDAVHVYVARQAAPLQPERFSLVETGANTGVFSGGVRIALGPEAPGNGTIEVANGETVLVTYRDQNVGTCSPDFVTTAAVVDAYSPDLTVASVEVTGELRAGSAVTVTGTVANDPRGGAAGASRVELFLFSGNNYKLIGYVDVAALGAGAPGSFSKGYTLPASLDGTWYVQARADSSGWVAERDETNNVLVRPVQIVGADLTVGSLEVTGDARAGGVITIDGTVVNDGEGGDAGTTRVALTLFQGNNRKPIGEVTIDPVARGTSRPFSKTYTIPSSLGGTWYVEARADSTGWVAERDEANNVDTTPVQIAGADLVVGSLEVTGDVRAGGVVTIAGTIVNEGPGEAGTSRVGLTFFQGNYRIALGTVVLAGLPVGASAPFTMDYAVPGTAAGTWYAEAQADAWAWVQEQDEANNVASVPVVLP